MHDTIGEILHPESSYRGSMVVFNTCQSPHLSPAEKAYTGIVQIIFARQTSLEGYLQWTRMTSLIQFIMAA